MDEEYLSTEEFVLAWAAKQRGRVSSEALNLLFRLVAEGIHDHTLPVTLARHYQIDRFTTKKHQEGLVAELRDAGLIAPGAWKLLYDPPEDEA